MKPSPLDYVRASSVDHAVDLLATDADVRVLAGGQSLLPVLNLRLGAPDIVVDISRLDELRSIEVVDAPSAAVGSLRVGAAVTQTELADHLGAREGWPMLGTAIAQIGHPHIRNRGTVCGSLAHNDPQAELPAVAVALDAVVTARSPRGTRPIPADELFVGPFTTTLDDDELITAVDFPRPPGGQGWSFREFARQPGDFATAGIAATVSRREDTVASRLVVFGLGGGPERATTIEEALREAGGPDLAPTVLDRWVDTLQPTDDAHTSARSKIRYARQLTTAAVAEAWGRMS